MKTQIKSLTKLEPARLPDGEYTGSWGGYVVTIMHGGFEYWGNTADGIRTPSAPCIVTVLNGEMSVKVNP